MSNDAPRPNTLRTADLLSSSPDRINRRLDCLQFENERINTENQLLKKQLCLVQENAGLRLGSLLATIISWFSEKYPDKDVRTYLASQGISINGGAKIWTPGATVPGLQANGPGDRTSPLNGTLNIDDICADGLAAAQQTRALSAKITSGLAERSSPYGGANNLDGVGVAGNVNMRSSQAGSPQNNLLMRPTIGSPIAASTPQKRTIRINESLNPRTDCADIDYVDPGYRNTQWNTDSNRSQPAIEIQRRTTTPPPISNNEHLDMSRATIVGTSAGQSGFPQVSMTTSGPTLFQPTSRLIGEICYQLDKRILNYVFNCGDPCQKKRFYGYIIQNIPQKIISESSDRKTGVTNTVRRSTLQFRYDSLLRSLKPLGYCISIHADFTSDMVNKYGLMSTITNLDGLRYNCRSVIEKLLLRVTPEDERKDVLVVLDCLALLAKEDGEPMIMW